MPESRRHESPRATDALERDSQIEALLVDGLDRYFNGKLEDAIHIWTRVLFLDRSHARARAYIERARTALAERQRRVDEMLQTSGDLLAAGRTEAARDLLAEAVAETGDDERAAALRLRLERLERAHAAARIGGGRPRIVDARPVPGWTWPRRTAVSAIAAVALAAVLLLVVAAGASPATDWLGLGGEDAQPIAIGASAVSLPALSSADVALVRARTLYTRGRLSEALLALDRVAPESPSRGAADRLRNQIQQLLLAGGPGIGRLTDPAEASRR